MPDVIQVAKERADTYGVKNVLVATAGSGRTAKRALRVFGREYNIFAVGTPPSSREDGLCIMDGISDEKRRELEQLGIRVALHDYSLLMKMRVSIGGEAVDISDDSFPENPKLSSLVEGAIAGERGVVARMVQHAFMWFGEGGKVCLEIAFMAADSGCLPLGGPCVAISTPPDLNVPHACMVLFPAVSEDLFTGRFAIVDMAHVPQYVPLVVEDLGSAFRFYRDLVGLEAASGDENGQYAEFELGDGKLALAEPDALSIVAENTSLLVTPELRGDQKLLFAVDDVRAASDRLTAAGVTVERGDQEWISAFRDPDGNQVRIMPH